MNKESSNKMLEKELTNTFRSRFPGIGVEIGRNQRWNRPCVTFRWSGFEGLLPEERFQRLVAVLPVQLREERLSGFIWLELSETETIDVFLKLPRSEDIATREGEIYADLVKAKLFDALAEAMGAAPEQNCGGDFREMVRLLKAKRFGANRLVDARLLMIRHHAFCDCQVLQTACGELAKLIAHAA